MRIWSQDQVLLSLGSGQIPRAGVGSTNAIVGDFVSRFDARVRPLDRRPRRSVGAKKEEAGEGSRAPS